MALRSDARPLADTTNQQNLPSMLTKRRRLSLSVKSHFPVSVSKSPPTCTLSRENVTVSASSDCITVNHFPLLSENEVHLFQFPSSSSSSPIPFPSSDTESEEPESVAPKRRRTSRSVSSYTTVDVTKRRRSTTKHRRSASVTHHSLLSPAASAPMLVTSSTTTTTRRFPSAEVRFVAMVRRAVLNGLHVDVPMIDLDRGLDETSARMVARSYDEIQEQNAVLADRLEKLLAEKGFQQPPPDVEAESGPLSIVPPSPTPTTSQLVALLIMRYHDRSAVRSRSNAIRLGHRASSPLSQ